jgi:hypothetical protein
MRRFNLALVCASERVVGFLLLAACTPLRDLDATAAGPSGGTVGFASGGRANSGGESAGYSSVGGSSNGGARVNAGESSGGTTGGAVASASGGTTGGSATSASGGSNALGGQAGNGSGGTPIGGNSAMSGGATSSGGMNLEGGSATGGSTGGAASGGKAGAAGATAGGGSGGASTTAPDLPDDLANSPVKGEIVYSTDATWMVDSVAQPTFEVHTPTASYWLVKSTGSIVSLTDASKTNQRQWIDYSSGFRPLRGVPGFGAISGVSTVLDVESQTPTHLRLHCRSGSGDWQWVWDFYLTHVTLTVNRAPGAYSFSYRGVPGGTLDDMDRLVLASGVSQGARNSYSGDFPGPVEWAYLVDMTLGRSLFMIQHTDDELPERYQVKDNDSALLSFGDGALVRTPQRFSLGLVDGGTHATVEQRVSFVIAAIR